MKRITFLIAIIALVLTSCLQREIQDRKVSLDITFTDGRRDTVTASLTYFKQADGEWKQTSHGLTLGCIQGFNRFHLCDVMTYEVIEP